MFKKASSRRNQYLTDTFVENGHNCDHMLALNSEKCNRRNETNDEKIRSNYKKHQKYGQITVDTSYWTQN